MEITPHRIVGMALIWIGGFMGGWTAKSILSDYLWRKREVRCLPYGPITKMGKVGDHQLANGETYVCAEVVKWPK